jgi:Amt family ammonium transporter
MKMFDKLMAGLLAFVPALAPIASWAQDAAAAVPAVAPAAPAPAAVAALNSGDTAWMLTATALVLFMTIPGLALFYGGLVRKKNLINTLMQCFVVTCLISVLWYVIGYSLAFTPRTVGALAPFIGSLDGVFMKNITMNTLTGSIPTSVFATFQMTFAIITPALIIGSLVERIKFSGLLLFMALWLIVVYCPSAYMVWGGGYLSQMGMLDFAGGNVVHLNAGVAGLVACLVLGHRVGFKERRKDLFSPNSIAFTMIGASMLWVGWFGFNAGSALSAGGSAGQAMLVTQLATATAGLAWMFYEWVFHGKPTLAGLTCGAVAGLVAITPASGFVDPMGAFWIGAASGVVCVWSCTKLKSWLGYDDSLDVVGVHGVGGLLGSVLTGVFAVTAWGGKSGWIEGNLHQLIVQIEGSVITMVCSAVGTYVILKVVDALVGLRVAAKDEDAGLDLSAHGEQVV